MRKSGKLFPISNTHDIIYSSLYYRKFQCSRITNYKY